MDSASGPMLIYASMTVWARVATMLAYRVVVFGVVNYIALFPRAKENKEQISKVGLLFLAVHAGCIRAYWKGQEKTNEVIQSIALEGLELQAAVTLFQRWSMLYAEGHILLTTCHKWTNSSQSLCLDFISIQAWISILLCLSLLGHGSASISYLWNTRQVRACAYVICADYFQWAYRQFSPPEGEWGER